MGKRDDINEIKAMAAEAKAAAKKAAKDTKDNVRRTEYRSADGSVTIVNEASGNAYVGQQIGVVGARFDDFRA